MNEITRRRIYFTLEIAEDNAEDAKLTATKRQSQNAPFDVQQAVEKMVKAIMMFHGITVTAEHNINVLLSKLPDDEPWKKRLAPYQLWSKYATSYRYVTTEGNRVKGPDPKVVAATAAELLKLIKELRAYLLPTGGGGARTRKSLTKKATKKKIGA